MNLRRRVVYITGTRADFGLMRSTLRLIHASDLLDLEIIATGMHLESAYGSTLREVEDAGLRIAGKVAIQSGVPSGALMATNLGHMITGITPLLDALRPDIVLVLGDRGEMLAAAIAGLHLGIPVFHIHGGERSGTVDEHVRHAITKLSSFHLVATSESRARLIRMGEFDERIAVVGAPGLDGLADAANGDTADLLQRYGLDPERPFALVLYHPVVQEADTSGKSAAAVIQGLKQSGHQIIALKPNSDAGSAEIVTALEQASAEGELVLLTHLARNDYLTLLRAAAILVGNSSSGIIEAATLGTMVVNIGTRQNLRQRSGNVKDVSADPAEISGAIRDLSGQRFMGENVYGDGSAGARIAQLLADLDLEFIRATKSNAY